MRPSTSSTSASGWQRFSQLYGAPCATALSTAARQSSSALVTAGTTCSGLIAEKGGREKGVNNGLVICAVLLKRVNEARVRRLCMRSRMGDSWGNFNDGRCVSLGIAAISPPVAGKARHAVQRAGNHINAFFAPSPKPPTDSAAARIAVRGWCRIAGNPPAARC